MRQSNPSGAAVADASVPRPRRAPERRSPAVASALAGYLAELATGVSVPPWSDFVDTATRAVFGTKGLTTRRNGGRELDLIERWRNLREPVLTGLAALGLEATVRRVDMDVPITEHHADRAGLVVVHHPGHPGTRYDPEPYDGAELAYQHRMHAAHGLRPHRGLPDTPRAFCGQAVTHDARGGPSSVEPWPAWWDKVRTWVDYWDTPTVTIEPCAGRLAAPPEPPRWDEYRHLDPIPLRWEAHPPLYRPGADGALLLIQWDADAEAPPAESTPRRVRLTVSGVRDDCGPDGGWSEWSATWLTPDEWTRAEIDRMRGAA